LSEEEGSYSVFISYHVIIDGAGARLLGLDIAHVSAGPQASAIELRDAVIDMTVAACAEAAVTAAVDGAPLRSLPMRLGTRDTKPLKLESRSTCMPPKSPGAA
jgi:hypothetical protein